MSRRRRSESGQSMTEYVLIIVLVAVAALVVLKAFGHQIVGLFRKSSTEIAQTAGKAP